MSSVRCDFDAWIYADDNALTYRAVAAQFKKLQRLISPSEFRLAVAARREAFVAWTDANMENRSIIEWLTTPLHRNSFSNHLFLHAVWVDLLAEMLISVPGRKVVVVTESLGLAHSISELGREMGQLPEIRGEYWMASIDLARRLRACAGFLRDILDVAIRISLSRIILGARYRSRLVGTKLLVETYVFEGDLNHKGQFNDRYFPSLTEQYEHTGRNSAIYPHFFRVKWRNLIRTYCAIRSCKTAFVPYELFISFPDVLEAGLTCLLIALKEKPLALPRWFRVSMSSLVTTSAFIDTMRSVAPLLLAKAPTRLAENGVRPDYFIDWFENQAIDKACVWGFANSLHQCNVIAARPYIPYANALSYFPSPGEVKAGICPKVNWIPGPMLERSYRRYQAGIRLEVVPSFRYDYLHNIIPETSSHKENTLLILLTHLISECSEILSMVIDAINNLTCKINRMLIKPHPILITSKLSTSFSLSRYNSVYCVDVEWTDQSLTDLLSKANLVITSGSSSAVEAICYGLPVIIVGRQAGLDFFPLEDVDPRMWRIADNSEELAIYAQELLDERRLSPSVRKEVSRETREGFFTPVEGNRHRFNPEQYFVR